MSKLFSYTNPQLKLSENFFPAALKHTFVGSDGLAAPITSTRLISFAVYLLSNNLGPFSTPYDGEDFDRRRSAYSSIKALQKLGLFDVIYSTSIRRQISTTAAFESIFFLAVECEDMATLDSLLRAGSDPNGRGCYSNLYRSATPLTPLEYACIVGNLKMADLLLKYGAKTDPGGCCSPRNMIFLAILGISSKLNGAQVAEIDFDESPFKIGLVYSLEMFLWRLLRRGSNRCSVGTWKADCCDWWGHTIFKCASPLTVASQHHLGGVVALLIEHGFKLTCCSLAEPGVHGPLEAALFGMISPKDDSSSGPPKLSPLPLHTISCLLQAGADPNTDLGAYTFRKTRLSGLLEHAAAPPYIKARYPMEFAVMSPHPKQEAIELISYHGGRISIESLRIVYRENLFDSFWGLLLVERDRLCTGDTLDDYCDLMSRLSLRKVDLVNLSILLKNQEKSCAQGLLTHMLQYCNAYVVRDILNYNPFESWIPSNQKTLLAHMPDFRAIHPDALIRIGQPNVRKLLMKLPTTLICSAILERNYVLAAFLIDAGLDLNAVLTENEDQSSECRHFTALSAAIKRNQSDLVDRIIARGAAIFVYTEFRTKEHCHKCRVNALASAVETSDRMMVNKIFSKVTTLQVRQRKRIFEAMSELEVCDACPCESPLTAARGNLELAKLLLDNGASPYDAHAIHLASPSVLELIVSTMVSTGIRYTPSGTVALNAAIRNGDISLVKNILAHKLAQVVETNTGHSPSPILAVLERLEPYQITGPYNTITRSLPSEPGEPWCSTRFLLEKRCGTMEYGTSMRWTVLHRSKSFEEQFNICNEILNLLIQFGFRPTETMRDSKAWQTCVVRKFLWEPRIISFLLTAGARPIERWVCLYHVCVRWGFKRTIEVLIDHNVKFTFTKYPGDADGSFDSNLKIFAFTGLQQAVLQDDLPMVKLLVSAGADVNAPGSSPELGNSRCNRGGTALQLAIERQNICISEFLIARGSDVNDAQATFNDLTALQNASMQGFLDGVRLLVEAGAYIDTNPCIDLYGTDSYDSPLYLAIKNGHLEVTRYLIENGADPALAPKRWNPLQVAAQEGHFTIIQLLVANNTDVNSVVEGRTALQTAVLHEQVGIARYLVENKADVNLGEGGALNDACQMGFYSVAEYLLTLGANVNASPPSTGVQRTALQHAAANGNLELVELLLCHYGWTTNEDHRRAEKAIELAEAFGHSSIRDLIKKRLENGGTCWGDSFVSDAMFETYGAFTDMDDNQL